MQELFNKVQRLATSVSKICNTQFVSRILTDDLSAVQATDLDDDQGSGKLYFTGPGYTINLIPQALLLGLLSFCKYPPHGSCGTFSLHMPYIHISYRQKI